MTLAPPAEGIFPTIEECERAVQAHAAKEGYAIVMHAKAKSKRTGKYIRYLIRCDKSGSFQSKATIGLKKTTTKKTNCPFSCHINVREDGCYFAVSIPEHNHPPSSDPSEHVQHRKLTEDQRSFIEAAAIEKKTVRVIHEELLKAYPQCYAKIEDVGNHVQFWKKKAKENATGVQALLIDLQEREDNWSFPLERHGNLEGILWVPRWFQSHWQRPDVHIIIIETKHIINQSVLSVIEMNNVLAANSQLGAGYAILPDKTDHTLLWLIQAIDKLRLRLRIPKPQVLNITDFKTAETNVLAEIRVGRSSRIICGRFIDSGIDESSQVPGTQDDATSGEGFVPAAQG
ncbi:uncharacterized protein F4822DRAFT_248516 [Hypoxylon trugodes]|uniref:uncharacterized protein n=1 Tax=Hypoxylon trugodes TaxID=326681 RepID=UPI0021976A1B|nr:uncharacterized protein F4822DRAFT_248516 [Hypoxylon trugodes]KAI1388515.1 hypothetical protein F4822DRAFT_248516 [Hypoxylon trugodes]